MDLLFHLFWTYQRYPTVNETICGLDKTCSLLVPSPVLGQLSAAVSIFMDIGERAVFLYVTPMFVFQGTEYST